MIFFKHSLITFTTLIVTIWVMPVTSSIDKKLEHPNRIVVFLQGMKLFIDGIYVV